jgi:phospholipase A2
MHPSHVQARHLFTEVRQLLYGRDAEPEPEAASWLSPLAVVAVGALVLALYPSDMFDELSELQRHYGRQPDAGEDKTPQRGAPAQKGSNPASDGGAGAWFDFSRRFEVLSLTEIEWSKISDSIVDFILPEWSKAIPGYLRKLQRELSMAPGSLADEIWREAHDASINPEIRYRASVRVSDELCPEEKAFLANRRRVTTMALARYLGLDERDVHPDDVPVIAMCGSGGGLRALVAASGSMMATQDDGLLDCLTYTSGVSGSCWLQALYNSSVAKHDLHRLVDHLKARLGVHIAYPPVAFQSLISAPTNKYLLSGVVEKLKGDPKANFGLVDAYGILLASRLLVPKGELAVDERDFKLSNQRDYIKNGEHPMPIYTAVRHEIPDAEPGLDKAVRTASEAAKEEAKQEAWFLWFEISPFEMFCEEFAAGIPTWAMGRRFDKGRDVPAEHGLHLPELRMPLLMGVFGSAFCATLSHYYREIQPIMRSVSGLGAIDDMISGRNEDLSKVHPIDPASIPNFVHGMDVGQLARTAPPSICRAEYLQLMDAGMSNNLPIYPLLRPGRNVDVLVAFDASADIKTENWLSAVDGYARQRGIKGWPVGAGWPKMGDEAAAGAVAEELESAAAKTPAEAAEKLSEAKASDRVPHAGADSSPPNRPQDLGYCTVWVGSTEERTTTASGGKGAGDKDAGGKDVGGQKSSPPPSKALEDSDSWRLMEPSAGIAVVYMPLLANPRVPGVNPGTSSPDARRPSRVQQQPGDGGDAGAAAPAPPTTPTDFLSTWNFVYTPSQVDDVVALARANYDEGKEKVRATVRAVYERKKRARELAEQKGREERWHRRVRRGEGHALGGDQFS